VIALVRRDVPAVGVYAVLTVASVVLARRGVASIPHLCRGVRGILYLGHPGLTPEHLHRVLALRPGERILEIGPGVGHHALPTARALGPDGCIDVLDVQPAMLAALTARAQAQDVRNIVATPGSAHDLPYPDDTFDGAYLVTVLGEIPDSGPRARRAEARGAPLAGAS
jgi:SAM-dependent methyltransferase